MQKLKIILQSKITYLLLIIFIIVYVILTTIIIKYDTKIDNFTYLEGIITDITYKEDKISFILESSEKIACTYYFKGAIPKDLLGKKVRVTGNLGILTNNTIPNTFNYKKYLYNKKIYLSYNVYDMKILTKENIFYKIKNKIISKINKFDSLDRAYLNLFLLGDKTYLDTDLFNIYKSNGIWHLFAISGMHIGLIIMVLKKLLAKIKYQNSLICLILLYFMFLTNFSASVLRAVIFYILTCLNNFGHLKLTNLKILFFTAFIILLFNPFMIYNIGFLYSFLITFTILLNSKKITGNYFWKIFKISLLSTIISLPITINMNYEINILSIFLNIFFVPFISLIVFPIAIISFFIPNLSIVLKGLLFLLEFLNKIFYHFKLSIIIPKMPLILIILYYLILLLSYLMHNKKILIFLNIILLFNILLPKLDNNYYLYNFDVSQGDSSIIITPHKNKVIMIDTGGIPNSTYNISDNIITFLKSIGINKIDLLIISHGDFDHMGDASNLINNFKIENVIFNCGSINQLETELITLLKAKNIIYNKCLNGISIDNYKLYFLRNNIYDNENANSNIVYMKIDAYKFLFMGDAGMEVEKDLLEKYALEDIDVLKVGHHGSKTSSSKIFIDSIKPKYSVISVGRKNRYGHPHSEVLKTLQQSKIYRTDQDGTIRFKINKSKILIDTYAP